MNGNRAHRGDRAEGAAARRVDAEVARQLAHRQQGEESGAEAPDRHDIDLVSHWPAWRMEVEGLAADLAPGELVVLTLADLADRLKKRVSGS